MNGAVITFDQVRHRVRQAIDLARSRAGADRGRIRVAHPANVVVARNIGGHGETHEASARQSVVIRDGVVDERTEQTATERSNR